MRSSFIFFFFMITLMLANIAQANPEYRVGSGNNTESLLTVMATTGFEGDLRYKCKDVERNLTKGWTDLANGETGFCLASVLIAD